MTDDTSTDRPPDGYEPLTLAAAANRLGITPNAVIQRRKRGSIYARRDAGEWRFWLPPVGTPDDDRARSRSRASHRTDHSDLAALVADLIRQNADLTATAAVMTERNRVLTERLAALEAGPVAAAPAKPEPEPTTDVVAGMAVDGAVAVGDTPERTQRDQDSQTPEPATIGDRLRRAWSALTGG